MRRQPGPLATKQEECSGAAGRHQVHIGTCKHERFNGAVPASRCARSHQRRQTATVTRINMSAHLQQQIDQVRKEFQHQEDVIGRFSSLFSDRSMKEFFAALHIAELHKKYENIAGVDIPVFESITFLFY
jgi:hypothetical protein